MGMCEGDDATIPASLDAIAGKVARLRHDVNCLMEWRRRCHPFPGPDPSDDRLSRLDADLSGGATVAASDPLAEAVARGAALLDEKAPGWAAKVDPAKLGHHPRNFLGLLQMLFGEWSNHRERVGFDGLDDMVAHGMGGRWQDRARVADLWRAAVAARLAVPQSVGEALSSDDTPRYDPPPSSPPPRAGFTGIPGVDPDARMGDDRYRPRITPREANAVGSVPRGMGGGILFDDDPSETR